MSEVIFIEVLNFEGWIDEIFETNGCSHENGETTGLGSKSNGV